MDEKEYCQRCNLILEDLRTIKMQCGYDMNEMNIPFEQGYMGQYLLRVCKSCRSDWMHAINNWWLTIPKNEIVNSGIFIRDLGALREISKEEWERRNPGETPYIFIDQTSDEL